MPASGSAGGCTGGVSGEHRISAVTHRVPPLKPPTWRATMSGRCRGRSRRTSPRRLVAAPRAAVAGGAETPRCRRGTSTPALGCGGGTTTRRRRRPRRRWRTRRCRHAANPAPCCARSMGARRQSGSSRTQGWKVPRPLLPPVDCRDMSPSGTFECGRSRLAPHLGGVSLNHRTPSAGASARQVLRRHGSSVSVRSVIFVGAGARSDSPSVPRSGPRHLLEPAS